MSTDPSVYQPWTTRWRRPILIAVVAVLAVGQWGRVSSGKPFEVVTGIGVVLFWVSVLFLTGLPKGEERTQPASWRRKAGRSALVFGVWMIVAWSWLGAAALWYSVEPLNFVVPAVPTVLTLSMLWTYRNADRAAHTYQRVDSR